MINYRKKSLLFFTIAAMAIVLAVMIFSLPFNYSVYATETDYETFDSTLSAMMKKYDKEDVVSASSVSAEGEDKGYCDTRLIVNSSNKINTMGAEMWCGYNDTFILQYTDSSIAAKAYDYYKNLNLNVYYDLDVCVNDYEVEEVCADGMASINSEYYLSWGWSSENDYMGARNYLTSLSAYSESALKEVVVAVLDTGINTSHTMFSGRILDYYAKDYTGTGTYVDDNGHGTHVSGTIAEVTPDCVKILPMKVLNSEGKGSSAYIIRALNQLINWKQENTIQNLKVVNMSLGISTSSASTEMVSAYATNITACVNTLYDEGVISVVSAGNENQSTANIQPANIANAITISALSVNGAGENRSYTNDKAQVKGTKLLKATYSNYGTAVDFAAPGTWIQSAYIGSSTATAYLSGTSMAAPHATACVALYYVHPNHNGDSVETFVSQLPSRANKDCLVSTGAYALTGDRNSYYGYGCLNIAELGIEISGTVIFSNTEKMHDSSFSLGLSYSKASELSSGQNYEIWYTDESIDKSSVTKDNLSKYNGAFTISKSSKITAVAYIYSGTTIVRRSEISSFTFYIGNKDLEINYEHSGGTITTYRGADPDLTTLVVPDTIDGVTITTIGSNAFSTTCYVKVLRITSTITKIYNNAFYSSLNSKTNTALEEVYFSGNEISIGANAFRGCVNLKTFDVDNITVLDNYALYNTSIETLKLFKTTTIGKYALSQTKLTEIYFGKNLAEIGNQTLNMKGGDVYGYNDVAENFANSYSANYHNMTFEITQNLPTKKYVNVSSQNSTSYKVVVNGANVSVQTIMGTLSTKTTVTKDNDSSTGGKNVFNVTLSNLNSSSAGKTVKIRFKDMYNETLDTESSEIVNVAGKTAYSVNDIFGSKFQYIVVSVNGEIIDDEFKFYDGITYTIKIDAQDGCYVRDITISGAEVNVNEEKSVTINSATEIEYNAAESNDFQVQFNCLNGQVEIIKINDENCSQICSYIEVARGDSITFDVENDIGFKVVRVNVNGSILLANADGSYTISNIKTDKVVDVIFELAYYAVDISYVNSCASYVGADLSKIAYGTKDLKITLFANSGYAIDFVTIDGKIVEVKNGTFTIDEVNDDVDVVVSFRQTKSIFSSDNSTILYYFIVFAVLFVIFILGRIALHFIRKHQAELEQKQ